MDFYATRVTSGWMVCGYDFCSAGMSGKSIDGFGVHARCSGRMARNMEGEMLLHCRFPSVMLSRTRVAPKVDSKNTMLTLVVTVVWGRLHSCKGMSASDGVRCHSDHW